MTSADIPLSFLLSGEFRDKYPHRLVARFPHVARQLDLLWNDGAAVAAYFSELMVSSRPQRQGFPPEVAAEIMALSMAYDRIGAIKPMLERQASVAAAVVDPWEHERAIRELERLGIAMTLPNFLRAIESGDEALCRLFIHAGFDVNARDAREWTPLMVAAFSGKETVAFELIRYGADIHVADLAGYTPLHWAAYQGYRKVVELLLVKGLPADIPSRAGITPMVQAAARGHPDVVKALLKARANPNVAARDGSTPLLKAVANGHLDVIELLLQAGASIDVAMKDGKTLREIARHAKNPAIAARIARAAHAPARGAGSPWLQDAGRLR
ncbi:MAG: hypothetical protein EYC67_11985 [Betaproteobacteria bacterium]|nr:MAG: hypothetical protein EYC67_11985 [Betaproteobacteria bacterium]